MDIETRNIMKFATDLILRLALGLTCVAMAAGCGKGGTPNRNDAPTRGSAITQEALKLAAGCAAKHWIIQEDGALWFGHVEHRAGETSFFDYADCNVQFKPVTPHLVEAEISEADRLNGVEWHGAVDFSAQAYRSQREDKSWKDWQPWEHGTFWSVGLEKRNGNWTVEERTIQLARSGNPSGIYFIWNSLRSRKPENSEK